MDFRSRGTQHQVAQPQPVGQPVNNGSMANQNNANNKWFSRGQGILLIGGALIIAAISVLLFLGGDSQAKSVDTGRYQAVFLNNGQVYFGKVKALNDNIVDLRDIYYLQTSGGEGQQQESSNVSLVKLGCELHAPTDQMIINYDQVIFWENLQDSGQVAKAIKDYKDKNPNGQKCSEASQSSTQQAPSTNTQENGDAAAPTAAPTGGPATNKKP